MAPILTRLAGVESHDGFFIGIFAVQCLARTGFRLPSFQVGRDGRESDTRLHRHRVVGDAGVFPRCAMQFLPTKEKWRVEAFGKQDGQYAIAP